MRLPKVRAVGRPDFREALEELRASLPQCSFMAIDTEMGGLSVTNDRTSVMDSVEERYAEYRASAQAFPIMQFGLSVFTWDAGKQAFSIETLQFPIFPRFEQSSESSTRMPDRRFLLQPKCLQFLRTHGFDLNEWVDQGIGYLSHAEQTQQRSVLARSTQPAILDRVDKSQTVVMTNDTHRFLERMEAAVAKALSPQTQQEDNAEEEDEKDALTTERLKTFLETANPSKAQAAGWDLQAYVTEPLAPFRRFALLQHLKQKMPELLALDCAADHCDQASIDSPWKRRVRLVRVRSEQQAKRLMEAQELIVQQEMRDRNLDLIGFTSVLDLMVASGKPIVGHNMLLDLMQCFDKFHAPLPPRCASFLHDLHAWISVHGAELFDTKEMVTHAMQHLDAFSNRLEHSGLEHVFETLSKNPFHGPAVHFTKTDSAVHAHQAGYDAFMTGFVFLRVCSAMGVRNDSLAALASGTIDARDDKLMQPFRQALHVSHLLPATMLRLPGPFPKDCETHSRAHFVRLELTRTPAQGLKSFHIKQCLGWALNLPAQGQKLGVHWEGRKRVFVALPSPELALQLLELHRETKQCEGSVKDPMPSIGCVDLFPCESSDALSQKEDPTADDEQTTESSSKRRRTHAGETDD